MPAAVEPPDGRELSLVGRPLEAIRRGCERTQRQPWLVHALALQIVDRMEVAVATAVTVEHVDRAAERMIVAWESRLDCLLERLRDPAVPGDADPTSEGLGQFDAYLLSSACPQAVW
jgi:hypothetical protein